MLGDHGVKPAGQWKTPATLGEMEGAVKQGTPAMVLLPSGTRSSETGSTSTAADGTGATAASSPWKNSRS